jgi:hypothetical protein
VGQQRVRVGVNLVAVSAPGDRPVADPVLADCDIAADVPGLVEARPVPVAGAFAIPVKPRTRLAGAVAVSADLNQRRLHDRLEVIPLLGEALAADVERCLDVVFLEQGEVALRDPGLRVRG